MGACLSCLGLRGSSNDDADRQRLLYDDYQPTANNYGTWGPHAIPPENVMSPDEVRREQEEFNRITQKASDQIVEIFPHQPPPRNIMSPTPSSSHVDGQHANGGFNNGDSHSQLEGQGQSYQDILLSLIPGDKSKRSIRIYPASRPSSSANDAPSVRSKGSSSRLNGVDGALGEKASGVFVKLDVDLP